MMRAIKTGFVVVAGATVLLAFPLPGWAQRGGARGSGGFSHGSAGISRGSAGVSRGFAGASRASVGRAPVARVAPRVAARPLDRRFAPRSGARSRVFVSSRVPASRLFRDRFGRFHRVRPFIFYNGYPGYYYYYPFDFGYDDSSGYAAQQPAIDYDQPAQDVTEEPAPAPTQYAAAAPAPPPPLPDVGEYILVRNDGRVVFASAFTISGDHLTYITREGARRSLPVAELDKDATRRMNEAAGTTVVLPS